MDDDQRLLEARDPVVIGIPERGVVGFVPAGAETEDEPSVADLVDGRGFLGDDGRIVKGGTGDEDA